MMITRQFENHKINGNTALAYAQKKNDTFDVANPSDLCKKIIKKYGSADVQLQEQERAKKEADRKEADRVATIKTLVSKCNFPTRYKKATLTPFVLPNGQHAQNQQRVLAEIKTAWNNQLNKFVVLFGGFGLGKTHFAIAIGKIVLQQAHECKFIRAYDYAESENDFKKDVKNFKESKVLILDELGDENIKERHLGAIRELLMHRDANNLRTIITSNLDLDLTLSDGGELGRFVGERIYDRLSNSVGAVGFGNGKSLRGLVG